MSHSTMPIRGQSWSVDYRLSVIDMSHIWTPTTTFGFNHVL